MGLTDFRTRACLLLALTVTVAVYWHGLPGPFVFDDFSNVTEIRLHSLDWAELSDVAFSNASGLLRRPLANASFALNDYFFGPDPFSFKVVNLILHLLCGLLVFALARRLLLALEVETETARLAALLTTVVWLLHPLQVSTVFYTVQRMAQLSALFTLAALWAYLAGRTRLTAGNRRGWWFMALAFVVLSPLGLASKENAALIPAFMLAVEFFVFRFATGSRCRTDLRVIWGIGIALPLFLGVLYTATHFAQFQVAYELRSFTMLERLLTQPRVLWFYLYLIFLPLPALMGFYHDDFPVSRGLDLSTSAALAGILLLVTAALALRRRAPLVGFGIAWFLIAHALEGSFIGLELVFEHRNYLALFGPALVMAWGAVWLTRRVFTSRRLRMVALVAPLVLLAGLGWLQVQHWSGIFEFLANHAVNKPQSARANAELASYYAAIGDRQKSDEYFQRYASLVPHDPGTAITGLRLWCARDNTSDEAIDAAVARIGAAPQVGTLAHSLALLMDIWVDLGRCPALTAGQLVRLLDAALSRPEIGAVPTVASNLHAFRATALRSLGEREAALEALDSAIALKPGDVDLQLLRAYLQLSLRRYEDLERSVTRLRAIDAASFRNSTRHIDALASSLAAARQLEQRFTALAAGCVAEQRWADADLEATRALLATSDVGWVVLPKLEPLIAFSLTSCLSSAGPGAVALLDALEQNPVLHAYLPGQARVHSLRARVLRTMGFLEDSLEAYRQAMSLDPTGLDTAYELAYLQLDMGRLDEARATTERIRQLESATEPGNDGRLGKLEGHIDSASK